VSNYVVSLLPLPILVLMRDGCSQHEARVGAARIVFSAVILFDPILRDLAIALMAGEVASLTLSRMTVPVVYFILNLGRAQ
jgi:hypothetical protein